MSFSARLRIYSINLKAVEGWKALTGITSFKAVLASFITTEKARVPNSTAVGCDLGAAGEDQGVVEWLWVPLPVTRAVPQCLVTNSHLRRSTRGETKHICWYLFSESLLTAKYFSEGYGETTPQRNAAFLLSSIHQLN